MASLNSCAFIGNLGSDPDIRTMQNGDKVANLSIACSESWTDKATGERKERTDWVPVVIFGDGLVSVAERFLRKGSKVYVQGRFQTRSYEKDGAKRYVTEIVLRGFDSKLVMLDGKSDSQPSQPAQGQVMPTGPDDDIPFIMEWRG